MNLPPPLPVKKQLHHASVWQLVLSIVGLTLSLLSGLALLLIAHLEKSGSSSVSLNQQQIPFFLWTLGLMSLLAIPSIVYAVRRISGKYSPALFIDKKYWLTAAVALPCWAVVLYVGSNATKWNLPAGITSPLDILVIVIPILFLLMVGLYRLTFGGEQRAWAMINITSFVTMQLILLLEVILFVIAILVGAVWLFRQPQYAPYLSIFKNGGTITEQSLQPLINGITPLLSKPGLYAAIILLVCLLAPMLEELFKPLGVWLMAGKKMTPSQGFTAGLICGATFGLLESLSTIYVVSGNNWVFTAVARIGTGLLHTLTAGLSGWALARTLQDNKYIRISLMYIGVVLLHGCWNLFAILMAVNKMILPINSPLLDKLSNASSWVLVGLAVAMLVILVLVNTFLRRRSNPPVLPELSDKLSDSLG